MRSFSLTRFAHMHQPSLSARFAVHAEVGTFIDVIVPVTLADSPCAKSNNIVQEVACTLRPGGNFQFSTKSVSDDELKGFISLNR